MLGPIRQFLKSPVFEDSDKTSLAKLINTVVYIGLALTVITVLVILLFGANPSPGLEINLAVFLIYLVTLTLLHRGYVHAASMLLLATIWILLTIAILFSGGLRGVGISGYIIISLIAMLLVSKRAGLIYLLASCIASLVITALEYTHFLPPSVFIPDRPTSSWIVQVGIFVWMALLLFITARNLNEALRRTQKNESALEKAYQEQAEIRASLEAHSRNLERRIVQVQVASEVARVAATVRQVDELLNRAVNLVRDQFGFYHAGIFLLDERREYAVLQAATGEAGKQMLERGHKLKVGEVGIVGYVAGAGQPRVALEVGSDSAHFKNPLLPDTRSELALPLRSSSGVIGVLDVQSQQPSAFGEEDISVLQTMADQLTVAIENARLFDAHERQLKELSILHAVATAGAEATSLNTLLERATQLIGETFSADEHGVLLLDETGQVLKFHPSYFCPDEDLKTLVIPLGQGISGTVARTGLPLRVGNVAGDPGYLGDSQARRSELCVPLKIGERIIGVINVESAKENAYSEADERVLSTIAVQLATAIEKVRLFEVERRRAAGLEALRQASLHLTSNLESKPVLRAILEHSMKLVSADAARLFLFDGDKLTFAQGYGSHGSILDLGAHPRPHGLTYNVARNGKRQVVADARKHPLFKDQPFDGAIVSLPLKLGDQVLGVLNLYVEGRPCNFEENELSILELLADQASIALTNARLYEEAQKRAEELSAALQQREELVRLRNEFIQNVSHELRTPLAIVRGYVELLNSGEVGEVTPQQKEMITIVNRRVHMLNKIVDDLTTILEAEAHHGKRESVDYGEIVRYMMSDFQATARQAGLSLVAEIEPNLPNVLGNPIHMHRVLDNLVGNAFKFTPPGGKVILRLYKEGKMIVLEVSDNGVGIPADKLERIFERFYQVDGSSTRRYGGTGLGLALVKEISEMYGGDVAVKSKVGMGSTFTVKLPGLPIE